MRAWTLAKGQKNSKTLLEPRKPREVSFGICRTQGPLGLHFRVFYQGKPGPLQVPGSSPSPLPQAGPGRPRLPEAQTRAPPAGLETTFRLGPTLGRPAEAGSPEPPSHPAPSPLQDLIALPTILTPGLDPHRLLTAIAPSQPHPRVTGAGAGARAHSTLK